MNHNTNFFVSAHNLCDGIQLFCCSCFLCWFIIFMVVSSKLLNVRDFSCGSRFSCRPLIRDVCNFHDHCAVILSMPDDFVIAWYIVRWFTLVICFAFCFVLSCLVCTVLCSALLLDARFGVHFFLESPDISYFISTDFDRNQIL